MKSEHMKGIIIVLGCALVGLMVGTLLAISLEVTVEKAMNDVPTTAKPISQQQIGDDVNPDVLIIYEAEVDGETVYPAIIKESK